MNTLEKFGDIHTFIFDVDGVLTDNSVLVMENGHLLRRMSISDGFAIKQAVRAGYKIGVITGGKSEGVKIRLNGLGVTDVYLGVDDKVEAYEEIVDLYNLNEEGILYMGDDLPDYFVMRRVGLPTCPANACPEVKSIAQYISPFTGGEGCVRDVIEKVMRIKGQWNLASAPAAEPEPLDD